MKQSEKRLMAVCFAAVTFLAGAGSLKAEIRFGDNGVYSGREYWRQIEVSKQGRFFATTDFADTGFDPGKFLAGRTIEKTGIFPTYRANWKSDGRRTLFGVMFDQPLKPEREGQYDAFENKAPPFDRAVIWWGDEVPAAGAWSASIRTMDGKLVKLNPDTGKKLYPYDHSTLKLPPVPIKAFYIGLKGMEDGLTNYVAVRNLMLYIQPDPDKALTNRAVVVQPDFYNAHFSQTVPGMIDSLQPQNATYGTGVTTFRWMAPFIEYKGTNVFPAKKNCRAKVEASNKDDIAEYTLFFDLPGEKPVEVKVTSFFRQSAEKSVEFKMVAGNLPEGAKLGYRFYCPESAFGAIAEKTPVLAGNPIAVTTPAGSMKFYLSGAENMALAKADGLAVMWDWFLEKVKWIKLDAMASGKELDLAISLPVGSAGQIRPETLNYTWRPSLSGEGDGALAPFKISDLELLEEIDCGNPEDPHKYYDASNDPTVEVLKKKIGQDKLRPGRSGGNQPPWGFLAYVENPQDGAVPLENIKGQRCRAISDKIGHYFRYELKTKLKPRIPYLVVVEHAFDQVRRGEFHSIALDEKTEDLVYSRGLYGSLEAEPDPASGFRTEYILCNFQGLSYPAARGIKNTKDSIVFSNKIHSGPWQKAPGPAVKSIKIYRVKTMPELPDIAALAQAPAERQRSVTIWTEMDRGANTLYMFQYPKLLGYNAVWNHTRGFFGGKWRGETHEWCHPGTRAGNEMLFKAADEQGVGVVIHLGELLHLGFEGTDYDSFTDPVTYMGEHIPLKPTREELDHIAGALKNVLPALAKYRSLRDISTHFWPDAVITRRNLEDFRAATGAKVVPSPSVSENVQSLLNGGPELLRQWQEWAGAERFKFNEWLLAEVRKYRPDLFVTLLRYWDHGSGLVEPCLGRDMISGADRARFSAAGIKNLVDYLRFLGLDPALYAGNAGFMLELEAYSVLRTGREVPDYFETAWFKELGKSFSRGGLGIMIHSATLEEEVPLQFYHCAYAVPKTTFRKGLIRAFVYGNPRNVTIGSYNEPWGPRLEDFREFAVAYKLLPFVEPENYSGKIADTASQAFISKYGKRYGLVNNGEKETEVELELPAGVTEASDLSGGAPQKLETMKSKNGKPAVKIAMKPWSLKTLEMK
ncbi:MAG: hypothetical protein WC299_01405 [Kiritimatiellia bacterium]